MFKFKIEMSQLDHLKLKDKIFIFEKMMASLERFALN